MTNSLRQTQKNMPSASVSRTIHWEERDDFLILRNASACLPVHFKRRLEFRGFFFSFVFLLNSVKVRAVSALLTVNFKDLPALTEREQCMVIGHGATSVICLN
jgi:hypothetical protein